MSKFTSYFTNKPAALAASLRELLGIRPRGLPNGCEDTLYSFFLVVPGEWYNGFPEGDSHDR